MYGNYDGLGKAPPASDLYLGVNLWDSIVLDNSTTIVTKEIIHTPSLDHFHVCLVDKNRGIPFLSVLEVRFLKSNTYETPYEALMLFRRWDLGSICNFPARYKHLQPHFIFHSKIEFKVKMFKSNLFSLYNRVRKLIYPINSFSFCSVL